METQVSPEMLNTTLRFYMLLLMTKLAPPEGVVITMDEIEKAKQSNRDHLLIFRKDDKVMIQLMRADEAPLLMADTGGNA